MYRYDDVDRGIVHARVAQFRDQVVRYKNGQLSDDEFTPLRLQNGLYLQRHAYMLRIAIPYGTLSSQQLRQLAAIAERYDRGYGHFTTRQNIQFNWLELDSVPDVLADLAEVDMHAMQTSGNCVRNITSDAFAGVAADEVADPRPIAELLRQWSTLHPEFAFLPRKFKIAVTGSTADRAALYFHDIGIRLVKRNGVELGYDIIVGGGQGRTPVIGQLLRAGLPAEHLLPYVEAILRVYNLHGRRDNKYKARIKILLKALGLDVFHAEVEAEFSRIPAEDYRYAYAALQRIEQHFSLPATQPSQEQTVTVGDVDHYKRWVSRNVQAHKNTAMAIVVVTLKSQGRAPGDASATEMRTVAELAEQYSAGELRITHEQNLVLPHVHASDLPALFNALDAAGLGAANLGLVSDMIACPGLDYCSLANARSIPLAKDLTDRFSDVGVADEIGPLSIKISGCMNACGHHHVGHIGILGVEKNGREMYQLTLAGEPSALPSIGERLGPAIDADAVVDAVESMTNHYQRIRHDDETFLDTVRRTGVASFRDVVYDDRH